MSSYVQPMTFRKTHCAWCIHRDELLDVCNTCPKFRKYGLGVPAILVIKDFCSICAHEKSDDLAVYCRTNRFLQEEGDEDFECYKFCLKLIRH